MNETLETTVLIILSVVNLQLLLITLGTINTNYTQLPLSWKDLTLSSKI